MKASLTPNKKLFFDRDAQLGSVKDKELGSAQGPDKMSISHLSPQTYGSSWGMGLKCSKSHKQWMSAVKQYLLYTIGGAFVHELTESVTADTDLCMIKSDKILAWMGKGFLKSHPLAVGTMVSGQWLESLLSLPSK